MMLGIKSVLPPCIITQKERENGENHRKKADSRNSACSGYVRCDRARTGTDRTEHIDHTDLCGSWYTAVSPGHKEKGTGIPWIKLCIYGWNYGGYRQFQSRRSGLSGKAGSDKGALIIAGLVYVAFALIIKLVGYEKVNKVLPPIVTGPVIIVIGLRLSSSAINNAFYVNGEFNLKALFVTVCVLATVIAISIFAKGIFNLMPILFAIIVGFIVSYAMGFCDFTIR